MRWKSQVRFGGRAGETDLLRDKNRALVRSHYSSWRVNSPHAASEMCLASEWFFSIPATFRSSTTMTS